MKTHAVVRLNEHELVNYVYRARNRGEPEGRGSMYVPVHRTVEQGRILDRDRSVYFVDDEEEASQLMQFLATEFPGTQWISMELTGAATAVVERVQRSVYDKQKGLMPV